jgi:addiction module RelE/StbE family toxin
MILVRDEKYTKREKKFFRKHSNLIKKYAVILKKLQSNPFDASLKTHKLSGKLEGVYSCSLDYQYRIIVSIVIIDDKVYLVDIGTHDEVY